MYSLYLFNDYYMRNIVFDLHVKEFFPSIPRNISALQGCPKICLMSSEQTSMSSRFTAYDQQMDIKTNL